MKSIAQKLERISALVGTDDLDEWESKFVTNIYDRYRRNKNSTLEFSSKQVEAIDRIFDEHYGD